MTIQEKIFQHALKGASIYFRKNPVDVLNKLYKSDIERYAINELDLIERFDAERHCSCRDINSCKDSEIIDEFINRDLYISQSTIVEEDIFTRFEKIVQVENPLKILTILDQLEKDNNL